VGASDHADIHDRTVRGDHGLDNDHPFDSVGFRLFRVNGVDMDCLLRALDISTDAKPRWCLSR
jgi:hypothetical protein